ncbi:MAG: sodium ion-translocating decarboxylase subunit beta [Candidatus Merdivicinus sp.]
MQQLLSLFGNVTELTWQMAVMWVIGAILIYLGIVKKMEPTLLVPMGFGAILVNLPLSGAVTQVDKITGETEVGAIDVLFNAGIANELFPLLLFIGIGAMIDFTPLLSNPKMMLFGAAAQFGIFFTLSMACLFGFGLTDAASIAIIGAADGPTSIFVANYFNSKYVGAIIVAAYSYMALVPIVQPPVIRLITTKKERRIRMAYAQRPVSKTVRILFPIIITMIAGIIAPKSVALVGFLMFGNLIRECGVLGSLSETAQNVLANLITLLLGLTVATKMQAELFLKWETLLIMGLGLIAFIFDTAGGVLFAKLLNIFLPKGKKINPMVGAAGISAFPMSARVINRMGLDEDPENFLLMHAVGANVSGQIASVIAGGLILTLVPMFL